jgi:nitrous-oxide reductase
MARKDLIHPKRIQPRKHPRFAMYAEWAKEDGVDLLKDSKVVRKDGLVRVYMTSLAPNFALDQVKVKQGDTVQFIITNIDNVEDLSHGFCLTHYDVNMCVNSQDTNSITVKVDRPGVFWYYCPWFCHALHLEMRGRLIVEPSAAPAEEAPAQP